QAGYVGIGTKSTTTATNTPLPNFNLQLHGTADYSIIQDFPNPPLNLGKTTRLGFTNTTTGMSATDGVEFRMSENNFSLENRETGNIRIAVPTVNMTFSNQSSRIWVGTVTDILSANNARMNIIAPTSENGFYIQGPATSGKYGLSVRMLDNASDAIQVNGTISLLGNPGPIKNFYVKGNGEVGTKDLFVYGKLRVTDGTTNNVFSVDNTGLIRSREILVDNLPIPDYVFKSDYKLMTLKEVEKFVTKYHHLPNVKSELEFQEAGGVNLGEMNLKLLEKVEELTLYVIDLQKQIEELKNK
ncbi:MAG: hypothetical protein EBU01_15305, partial [Crocinitomicaceae bacterium]|nr:hypothetical protein [Crocinitomicaceae bacterium]